MTDHEDDDDQDHVDNVSLLAWSLLSDASDASGDADVKEHDNNAFSLADADANQYCLSIHMPVSVTACLKCVSLSLLQCVILFAAVFHCLCKGFPEGLPWKAVCWMQWL